MVDKKIGTFYKKEDVKTYETEEGDVTIVRGPSRPHGDIREIAVYSEQIDEENFLMQGEGERAVKLAAAEGVATHFNMYDPEVQGMVPKEDAVFGEYDNRFVGAVKLKSGEQKLPLSPTNQAISPGDKLEVVDPKLGLDKSEEETLVVTSWDEIPENTGGYILVDVPEGGIRVAAAET